MKQPMLERYRDKLYRNIEIDLVTGCWNWKAGRFQNDEKPGEYKYGSFWWHKGPIGAHRASWRIFRGEESGLNVLHKCHNMACCNPDHLYLGDHKQNMKDRDEAGRTSKWDHRYNFKRSPELLAAVMEGFRSGKMAGEVCADFGIGWQTVYRLRDQSPELKALMAETKSARYSAAARRRMA